MSITFDRHIYHPSHGTQAWPCGKLLTVKIARCTHDPNRYFWITRFSYNVWICSRWGHQAQRASFVAAPIRNSIVDTVAQFGQRRSYRPCVPRHWGALLSDWRQRPRPFPQVNPLSFAREVLCPKLKVRKPCNERGLQKLHMPDGHSQFVQSPLPFCDLGTEQILIIIVLRTARLGVAAE